MKKAKHLCKTCGETKVIKFPTGRKNMCTKCHKAYYKALNKTVYLKPPMTKEAIQQWNIDHPFVRSTPTSLEQFIDYRKQKEY